jgi:Peptidase family M48
MNLELGRRRRARKPRRVLGAVLATALLLGMAVTARGDRTHLKPGFNLFSPDQDIQLGRQATRDVEKQLPMLNNARVDNYLNALGHRLDLHVPPGTPKYPFQYKCVNDMAINAFALPGGFIYINRGVIEAADTEAQLAGVMAHETSHVVLRHSTNQISKASAWQVPLSLLGGMLGGNSIAGILARAGISSGAGLLFLKYSRTDESQADILGTQILYDSGYDPRAMAQFFEKIQAESKGHPVEFFSDHPNPDHRIERVDEEVDKLGGPPAGYKADSPEFHQIKTLVQSLPRPVKGGSRPGAANRTGRPDAPSMRYQKFENGSLRLDFPENWRSSGQDSALSFFPDGGIVDDGHGNMAMAYGVMVSLFEPHNDSGVALSIEDATDQLLRDLQRANPRMGIQRQHERMRLGGQVALSTYLTNDSPVGGRESDWLVTSERPDGLLYFICVAPENDSQDYDRAFQTLIDSVRFPN